MGANRVGRTILALLIITVLGGCTIEQGDDAYFHIENLTKERVALTWRADQTDPSPQPFKTLEPGENTQRGLAQECEESESLIAVTPSGRTYAYGPPVCLGDVWSIGAR
ncbi:hypothetical protein [Streptosporangium roseum]|uniref:Lipoprotein n=1 Tax=Streptosporangium roseum (strain ATCC 12428 / DSM 43021 / JCM 3005 / KCTC 9067 / NCIMB 10171 / NRRL 2505 / NI 9100) TaxID=479432 RepID=D2B592_STRRD|nr:hypothetical protein [Streptosporangium roseum]ACZ87616.1 hypothetical protein Sros_4788 [Streptosporangium roseum DSM 43021]